MNEKNKHAKYAITGPITTLYSGMWSLRAAHKAFTTPSPVAKGLYAVCSGLHIVGFVTGGICLFAGEVESQPVPLLISSIGQYAGYVARVTNNLADTVNPSGGAEKAIDSRLEEITKSL